ncbi:hypothetical protein BD324DRAFT_621930 [Kockovaella imperatae]|uniref:Uncharacterized protein n=1 Tax=Kockovaella imperatae TaxID=4999 RepID=A0A1Y1UNI4_9TREE|nr:hypothetical protein BD324DRAFT_621930 [Kockovaella imperatae]ORX38685.1 hypothetical protein BD324DRAFT_621930 [Kockovaella imperatae]
MSGLSLVMSILPLPLEMMPFYYLFSRLSMVAVVCLVCHCSIIWYGYNQAIEQMPKKTESATEAYKNLMKRKSERPDMWAHTRSHPSAFLTTRLAPPRIFPFPLGKSRPEATVRDELWWEGGNAPHVGHFNRPKLPEPEALNEDVVWARVKENMEREKQQKIWKKRIRTIQYLCVVIIVAFINSNVAIAGLCYLIYTTVSSELEDMLKPPPNMDIYHEYIDRITAPLKNQGAPKPGKDQPVGGMSYIYDPTEARGLKPTNTAIPINVVPPHVLMTSENHFYAGPGEQIKDPKK